MAFWEEYQLGEALYGMWWVFGEARFEGRFDRLV